MEINLESQSINLNTTSETVRIMERKIESTQLDTIPATAAVVAAAGEVNECIG